MGVDAGKNGSNGSNGAAHKEGYNATYKTLQVGDQMATEYSDDTASTPKNRRAGACCSRLQIAKHYTCLQCTNQLTQCSGA